MLSFNPNKIYKNDHFLRIPLPAPIGDQISSGPSPPTQKEAIARRILSSVFREMDAPEARKAAFGEEEEAKRSERAYAMNTEPQKVTTRVFAACCVQRTPADLRKICVCAPLFQ